MTWGGCGHTCDACLAKERAERTAKRAAAKAKRVPYDEAARRVGKAMADAAVSRRAEWAAEPNAHWRRHGFNRRFSSTDLAELTGLSAPVVGHVVRRFAPLVTEAAGDGLTWFLVSGEVQINPKDPT